MKNKILLALSLPFCHMIKDINKQTQLKKSTIEELLEELIKEDKVHKENKKYYLKKTGIITIKDKGFGFIKVEDEDSEYYVSEFDTLNSHSGDKVSFYVLGSASFEHLDSARVIKIIERKNTHVLGRLILKKNKKGTSYYVQSYDKSYDVKCLIDSEDLNGAVDGSIVKAKITKYKGQFITEGYIEKILGHEDDPSIDISLIAEKYSFFKEFPEVVMEEAFNIETSVNPLNHPNRRDFTNKNIITIDGDDSKDFDDAITVEILPNGNYYLGVFIADVSHYVTEGSYLDKEAFFRGTSVYLADRVIPMLPKKLSNGICSLNEGEYRLVLACEMEFSPKGKLENYEISEGIIKSKRRMTYNLINKMLDGDNEVVSEYNDIYPMITEAYKLSKIIRGIRTKKGAIDFEVPEYKVVLDIIGEPQEFILRTRDKAEMLIEDFMLSANETVAYHMAISNLPNIYRVHEDPNIDNVTNVFRMINDLGFKAILPKNKIRPKDIQKTMNMMKNSDKFFVINQLMLRSMAKARYFEKNLGHFGLSMDYYCHFTSPIRRYPDLMVHRLIKELIINPVNFDEKINHFDSIMHEVSVHSSLKEREAIECEREVVDMLMASFMENKVGQEFEGRIDSITKFGMFVLLDNGIEGLIHISNMNGYFTFDENTMTLRNNNMVYHIGDKVNIVCLEASKKKQKVDFMLKDDYYQMWRM